MNPNNSNNSNNSIPSSQSSTSSANTAANVLSEILPIYDRYFASSHSLSLNRADLTPHCDFIRIVELFSSIFQTHQNHFLSSNEIIRHQRVLLPYNRLIHVLKDLMNDFNTDLCDHPHMVLPTLSIAAHHAIKQLIHKKLLPIKLSDNVTISARIIRYPHLNLIRSIKASMLNRFVCFRANIIKVGPIKPLILGMFFKCPNCSTEEFVYQIDGRYTEPKSFCQCPTQFRGGPQPDRTKVLSIDSQTIRIQEIIVGAETGNSSSSPSMSSNNHHDADDNDGDVDGENAGGSDRGQIPKSFDCELTRDLVDCCLPGDVVTINGIIKSITVDPAMRGNYFSGKKSRQKELALYLDVHSVSTINSNNNNNNKQLQSKLSWIKFDDKQLESIGEMLHYTDRNVFKTLVHSLCPGIYGHELVKAGMILTLFSGNFHQSTKSGNSNNNSNRRSNSHILVVGDPGLGKSQMLKAVNNVSPRGVLVTGNTSSASGLTVAMVRDSGSSDGDFSIEAGALVLGDEGTTCIDEFDKLNSNHHSSLLEAMEQQTISITKAATVVTLPARTSVFAAANPVGGHYDRSKTVAENIKLSGPLLSRFDLIFILLDEPNEGRDEALSSHIIQLRKKQQKNSFYNNLADDDDEEKNLTQQLSDRPHDPKLVNKLIWNKQDEKLRPLSPTLLRLYIAYARRYCFPMKWTAEAKSCLYHHYLALRKKSLDGVSENSSPITARQLDSMIRLAESRAKCDMRLVVEESDAKDIIALMNESFRQIYSDDNENMKIDFRRGNDGISGVSKSKELKRLYQILVRRANERTNETFSRAEIKSIARECGLSGTSLRIDEIIDNLNQHNFILKGPGDSYKVQT